VKPVDIIFASGSRNTLGLDDVVFLSALLDDFKQNDENASD